MWNQALEDLRKYEQIYSEAKTGFVRGAGYTVNLETFLAEIYADPARKAAFLHLIDEGTETDGTPEDLVGEKTEPLIDLKDEVYGHYPQ